MSDLLYYRRTVFKRRYKMKTDNRKYWEAISMEMEEAVSGDLNEGIYNESHIPDLEELSSTCPFEDLSERLLGLARAIHCRSENEN